ncbi:MAG: SulP family inorganic anion transporter [Herminiimonas sp.]|nr:SulP family inorganic anion transporter [Herminiimonas sp.]
MDLVAGVSLAGLLLPEAVAYSTIAGLPPQAGIFALFAGLICYGLLGTSRFAITSATSSSAAVLAVAVASLTGGNVLLRAEFAMGLVLLTGLLFVVAGAVRAGNLSEFIAKPVLRGFAFGLAIVIIVKQVAGIVGVHPAHADLPRFIVELIARMAHWNWTAGGVGIVALFLLFLFGRLRRVPGGLLVVVLGILAESMLNLSGRGVPLVGPLQLMPVAPSLPDLSYAAWLRVGEVSMAMVLVLYAESYSSIRSFAMKHGDKVTPNRDLLALGVANLVSGLFHGMPVGAGFSATAANEAAGATSRIAGGVAALTLLAIVAIALPAIAMTPQPVLAAIVIHALSHTLNPAVFRPYFAWRRDRLVIVVAVCAVLILGVLDGLLVAVAVSLLMLLQRLSESSVTVLGRLEASHDFVSLAAHPKARAVQGMVILRPDAGLFFANADRVLTQARHMIAAGGPGVHAVILSLEESPDLDGSAIEALGNFSDALQQQGKRLFIARLKTPAHHVLERAALPGLTSTALTDLSVDDAVSLALEIQMHEAL